MIGQTMSHYRIVNQLGSGGMGVVYRAVDTRLGREVALKFLAKQLSTDRAAIDRFQREARITSSLDHPNICAVHDVGEHDGQPFIVMPLLHGQSLKDCLAGRRLKVDDLIEYGIQIADALVAAHARGILHCDIKPANIFVTERNEPKLLDFGVAKLASTRMTSATDDTKTCRTDAPSRRDSLVGTVAYMSPEQSLGEEQDVRSDIFSLGVTLYEAATGELPFGGPTSAAVSNAIINHTPMAPSTINPRVPPDLDRLIVKALEKERALRYQTAADLLADLKRARRALRSMAESVPPRPDTRRRSVRQSVALRSAVGSARPVLPTEAINPVSLGLDRAAVPEIIDMMVNEERKVATAVHREKERIAQGIEIIMHSLQQRGRLIFVGAGSSGRLGVLEATEMPPTFGTPPRLIQAIMAGGNEAVLHSKQAVEAEDRYEAGARSVARMRISKRDVVIGVSASGKTPFVRGALARGGQLGAKTLLITCWPGCELEASVDLTIAPAVGAEIIAGSTRLKAASATKMVLNMLTTISMVRLGKTYGNLMVDVQARSSKLAGRARRTLSVVTGLDDDKVNELLRRAHGNVKAAIVMQKTGVSYSQSLDRLAKANGSIREATGEDLEGRLRELLRLNRVATSQP
jgi:N-acetylmuramic acid 6-phosphate etherase